MTVAEQPLCVTVVQPRLVPGEPERNLARVADLVGQAVRECDPQLVVLPDALTSPAVAGLNLRSVIQPVDGPVHQLLIGLAKEHGCWVTGGALAVNGGRPCSAYLVVEPNGATHLHEKDQADIGQAHVAAGSYDDGFASTPLGPMGVVSGLEWLRTRTARRLTGSVRLLVGGACWWVPPVWDGPLGGLARRESERAVAAAHEAPARLARIVGAPAALAQQVGEVRRGPPNSRLEVRSRLPGGSRIVDGHGRVLAELPEASGEGYVAATVMLREPEPRDPVPTTFWLDVLPTSMHASWLAGGAYGRWRLARARRAGIFPWGNEESPRTLAYTPADVAPELRPERSIVAEPVGVEPVPAPADKHRASTARAKAKTAQAAR